MNRNIVMLLAGEALALAGLWLAWVPLAFLAAGGQLIAVGLMRRSGEDIPDEDGEDE